MLRKFSHHVSCVPSYIADEFAINVNVVIMGDSVRLPSQYLITVNQSTDPFQGQVVLKLRVNA